MLVKHSRYFHILIFYADLSETSVGISVHCKGVYPIAVKLVYLKNKLVVKYFINTCTKARIMELSATF